MKGGKSSRKSKRRNGYEEESINHVTRVKAAAQMQ